MPAVMLQNMRKKSLKSKEKATFKLRFRASSVPKSWEKLQLEVSLVPVNGTAAGKTAAKTGKETVKDGNCHWYEPLFECINVSRSRNGTEDDAEKLPYKLIVSTGSSLFGILGEAHIDFREHLRISEQPVSLPLPLENCKFGSILHVEIWRVMVDKSADSRYQRTASQESMDNRQKDLNSMPMRNRSRGDGINADPFIMDDHGGHLFLSFSSSHSSSSGRHEAENSAQDRNGRLSIGTLNTAEEDLEKSILMKDGSRYSFSVDSYDRARVSSHGEVRSRSAAGKQTLGLNSHRETAAYDNGGESATDYRRQKYQHSLLAAQAEVIETRKQLLSSKEDEEEWHKESIQKQAQQGSSSIKSQELENELSYLQSKNSSLSFQLQQAQESSTELLSEIQALKSNLELEKKEKLAMDMESSKRTKLKESELLEIVESLRTELKEGEQESLKLRQENWSLTTKLASANETLKEKENIITRLEHQIANITEECLSFVNLVAMDHSIAECNSGSYEDLGIEPAGKTLEEHLLYEEMEITESMEQICDEDDDDDDDDDDEQKEEEIKTNVEMLNRKQHEPEEDDQNSKLYQALTQLKTQILFLFQHSNHLLAALASKESELAILKKENLELEDALFKSNSESTTDEQNVNRILALENELAEVLEANDMYKSQLQSAFAKHQIVNAVALETAAESAEQVIKDISRLKRENAKLTDELCDLQKRYFNMSLQFAEVEAERGELVMRIRNLGGKRKLMPYQSLKF